MKGVKYLCTALLTLCITCLLSLRLSSDVSAATTSTSTAYVSFWSSSSPSGQVTSSVNLPWDTNVGGSSSDLQQFYLNTIIMNYPITALATDNAIYGRLVMRFTPWFSSTEDAYFCDKHLNDYQSSVEGVSTMCSGTVTYNYADGSDYSVSSPLYFNYSLPSGNLNAYVDYNLSLPNTALSSITFTISKSGSYDVYSIPSGYGLVLTTLTGDASYYIGSSSTNLDPIINQNNTIINQNQQMIDRDSQDREQLQDSSDSASDTATNLGNQVTARSTNLITLIGNFINVVLNPPASDCVIDGDMGHMDLGDIDLCELSPPPAISVIGGLLILGMLIPLVLAVIWRFIRLLRFVVGGM